MLETGIGRAANLARHRAGNHVAGRPVGVGAVLRGKRDLTTPFELGPGGTLAPPHGPGLGIAPDPVRSPRSPPRYVRSIVTLIETARAHSADVWSREIVPALHDYIRIPNVSAAFDPGWAEHGYMAEAVELIRAWCAEREIAGLTVDVRELPGRTPLIVVDVPSFGMDDEADGPDNAANETVILYGHLDKQPEMSGWRDDLGPWTPVVEDDRLYGREEADDGYAAFASLTAIEAVQRGNGSHHRCIVLIEASEESGSPISRPTWKHSAARSARRALSCASTRGASTTSACGSPPRCGDWSEAPCRSRSSPKGVHSGEASGVVPSTFRIARQLLDRVEDVATGEVLVPELHVDIPDDRLRQARATAAEFAEPISAHFPFVDGSAPMIDDPVEQMLNRTWRPTLSVVGAEGLPPAANAGNVLRPRTALKLSFGCRRHAIPNEPRLRSGSGSSPIRPTGARDVRRARDGRRLERADHGSVARAGARRRLERGVGQASSHVRRRRLDPVHGHARHPIPGGSVRRSPA